jgi:hypothetical protein
VETLSLINREAHTYISAIVLTQEEGKKIYALSNSINVSLATGSQDALESSKSTYIFF